MNSFLDVVPEAPAPNLKRQKNPNGALHRQRGRSDCPARISASARGTAFLSSNGCVTDSTAEARLVQD